MSTVDTDALDEAVRRFPLMLKSARKYPMERLWPDEIETIVREYRLVLAERSKGRLA